MTKLKHYQFKGSKVEFPVGRTMYYVDENKTFSVKAEVIGHNGDLIIVMPLEEEKPLAQCLRK